MTATDRRSVPMSNQQKVYLDGKVYVCRGNNIIRVK
ncbi:hypothetical protein SEA_HUTC2_97 [Mycobacterium phage Hutc2]|nr:hypothetical protein SEA_SALZ_96 [Mycobacterium phage Salz]QFG05075.1 hypothetical protein SEA_HUTC2_97 [Mycobacterium phage Hutc2]